MAARWKLPQGTTWQEKLRELHPNHGKVVAIPAGMRKQYGSGTMVIPRPLDVEALMGKVRKGRLITSRQIRVRLAADAGADHACPFSTGIFVRIVAEAAAERLREGKSRVTPYWRTIRDDGSLHEKFPGGVRALAAKLRDEGFTIVTGRGKKPPKVQDFERFLVRL
jgi:hypothetical protein